MTKTKYLRDLCVWHGCKNAGKININGTHLFCQKHWDMLEQDRQHHEQMMKEIRERGALRREARIGQRVGE